MYTMDTEREVRMKEGMRKREIDRKDCMKREKIKQHKWTTQKIHSNS